MAETSLYFQSTKRYLDYFLQNSSVVVPPPPKESNFQALLVPHFGLPQGTRVGPQNVLMTYSHFLWLGLRDANLIPGFKAVEVFPELNLHHGMDETFSQFVF